VHCSEETEDDRANALLPKTSTLPHSMEGANRPNLHGKSTPFLIFVKNKYFKISKLCKHVPLLFFNFHAYGLFTNWKIQTYYFDLLFFLLFPPEMSLPLCNQPINIQPPRQGSHHILQTWPGQLKLCWKHFHTNGKTKVKIKTEKIHKQKTGK